MVINVIITVHRPLGSRYPVALRERHDHRRDGGPDQQQGEHSGVFQDFALFPHLSAAENVGFGLDGWAESAREGDETGVNGRVTYRRYLGPTAVSRVEPRTARRGDVQPRPTCLA